MFPKRLFYKSFVILGGGERSVHLPPQHLFEKYAGSFDGVRASLSRKIKSPSRSAQDGDFLGDNPGSDFKLLSAFAKILYTPPL